MYTIEVTRFIIPSNVLLAWPTKPHTWPSLNLHAITKEKVKSLQFSLMWFIYNGQCGGGDEVAVPPFLALSRMVGGWKQWGGEPGPPRTMLERFTIGMHVCNGRDGMLSTKARFRRSPGPDVNNDTLASISFPQVYPHHCAIACVIIQFNRRGYILVGTVTGPNNNNFPPLKKFGATPHPKTSPSRPPRWLTLIGDMAGWWGGQTTQNLIRTLDEAIVSASDLQQFCLSKHSSKLDPTSCTHIR